MIYRQRTLCLNQPRVSPGPALQTHRSRPVGWRQRIAKRDCELYVQANGNWGLLPGAAPHLHVHIYGRRRGGKTWAQPVDLPKAPRQFGFAPLPESDRERLAAALAETFGQPASE